jgi:hypothetical protein
LTDKKRADGSGLMILSATARPAAEKTMLTPITMSFDVPKIQYKHAPVNVVYKP